VNQGIARDNPADVDEKTGQGCALAGTAQNDRVSLRTHLQRAQYPVAHC
jgi:hypothetical protein